MTLKPVFHWIWIAMEWYITNFFMYIMQFFFNLWVNCQNISFPSRGSFCDGKLKAPVKPCAGNQGTQIMVSRDWTMLILNVRGPSFLCLTRSISWLLMPWLLTSRDISNHDIDYVEYVSLGLTWGRILSTCAVSVWSYDIKCKYMFMFPLQNVACKGLTVKSLNIRHTLLSNKIVYHSDVVGASPVGAAPTTSSFST